MLPQNARLYGVAAGTRNAVVNVVITIFGGAVVLGLVAEFPTVAPVVAPDA